MNRVYYRPFSVNIEDDRVQEREIGARNGSRLLWEPMKDSLENQTPIERIYFRTNSEIYKSMGICFFLSQYTFKGQFFIFLLIYYLLLYKVSSPILLYCKVSYFSINFSTVHYQVLILQHAAGQLQLPMSCRYGNRISLVGFLFHIFLKYLVFCIDYYVWNPSEFIDLYHCQYSFY